MLTKEYFVVSVMSGTSLDGIDMLYTKFEYSKHWDFKIIESETIDYNQNWLKVLRDLTKKTREELQQIDNDYSKYLARKIQDFINSKKIKNIDFIASHGHTALHNPQKGYTYQIGNQQVLADTLSKKVICDFRAQDVQFGGQGAPLVPIGDRLLFSKYDYCVNLGGFANVSFEDATRRIAYDICPVNIVLNYYSKQLGQKYDDKGHIAQSGTPDSSLLSALNSLDYYTEQPPKSLGLEWVEKKIFPLIDSYNFSIETVLRTFVEHAALQIANTFTKQTSVLLTGGGAYNLFLLERIKVYTNSEIIIPSKKIIEFKEALIFGLLGVLKERNEVNVLSSVTGAYKNHSSGKVLLP